MRISKVRKYINEQVIATSPLFREWEDAFNIDNIPRSIKNYSFHVAYSVDSIESFSGYDQSNIGATVSFFFDGKRNPKETLDESMDMVNICALNIVSESSVSAFRATDDFPIQRVTRLSQVPTPILTNDNQLLITLRLELQIIQTTC